MQRNEEGEEYRTDVESFEQVYEVKLSTLLGSLLGDIGMCMQIFEEGRAAEFDILFERLKSITG